jgi:pimeloyl-ACP methyl ester carboxylesterase
MPSAKINSKSLFYTLTPSSSSSPTPLPLTLLFIHGLGSSSSFYAPLVPHLTALGYHCLTLDTHGSGSSPYNGISNSIASIASDVLNLLDSLNISENVVVVGHSMGGIVASHLAATDERQRFMAVVLIGPVNPNPEAAGLFGKRIGIVERGMRFSAPSPTVFRSLLPDPFSQGWTHQNVDF